MALRKLFKQPTIVIFLWSRKPSTTVHTMECSKLSLLADHKVWYLRYLYQQYFSRLEACTGARTGKAGVPDSSEKKGSGQKNLQKDIAGSQALFQHGKNYLILPLSILHLI